MSDLGDLIRLDRYRERVEVDTNARPMRREKEPVYVIAADRRVARAWAARNKPGCDLKYGHPNEPMAARGLYLKDVPVYVLNAPDQRTRDEWNKSGARLIFL